MRLVLLLAVLLAASLGAGYWVVAREAPEKKAVPKATETYYPVHTVPGEDEPLTPSVEPEEEPEEEPEVPATIPPEARITPEERSQAQEPLPPETPAPAPTVEAPSEDEVEALPPLEACSVRRREPLPPRAREPYPLKRFLARGREVLLGVEPEHGAYEMWRVEQFECAVDRRVDFVQYAQPFDEPFHQFLADRIWLHGSVPVLTWEPWSYKAGIQGHAGAVVEQPRYSLRRVIAGRHDTYIRRFARGVRHFGRPVLLRFGPEMNGRWNAWSEGVNGNRTGDYIKAWRRIHGIFQEERAQNVLWVWSPNTLCNQCGSLARYYPGDAYVDVLGADGYNWGKLHSWNEWRWFEDVFAATFREFARIAPSKPILIAETASAEQGGDKARWVADLLADIDGYPRLSGLVWFNHVKETDWRVQSSEDARAAFVVGLRETPRTPAAGLLRKRIGLIEARYHRALKQGYLYP